MTSAPVASRPWSRRRWWGLVALVFVVQLALIFWLGETSPIRPRFPAPAFTLRLAGSDSAELLALRDPTLFVLPRVQIPPARTWLKPPYLEAPAFAWPESTTHPAPAINQLATVLNGLVDTNHFSPLRPLPRPEPRQVLPDLAAPSVGAGQSVVQLEGALARRRLLAPLALRSWDSRDILTNSVVQVLVDAEGIPRSVTLLAGSGFPEADQYALDQAKAARFDPLGRSPADPLPAPAPAAHLSWGRMVFCWRTLPLSATNAPPVGP